MSRSRLSPEQWAQARRLRSEGAAYTAVAAQFGVGTSTVKNRARAEGWPSPVGAPSRTKRQPKPAPLPADTAAVRRALMHRLYALMGLSLEMTELRMQKQLKDARHQARKKDGKLPAAPGEEDMRQLAHTMKTIEQATELDPDLDRAADGGATQRDAEGRASEADAFRREVAERLEKLVPPSAK